MIVGMAFYRQLRSALCILLWLSSALVHAQSFLDAISVYPELSNFTRLMRDNPTLAGALLTSNTSSLGGRSTILVPDNSAFSKVSALFNISMGALTVQQLEPYLAYHVLVEPLLADNFTDKQGMTIPTFLSGPTYNNRSAGAALGSSDADGDPRNGQVVFLQAKEYAHSGKVRKFTLRQLENPTVNVQGGLGHISNLTAVDGKWDGGYFQIVDKFLALPLNCTDTIRRWRMSAFRASLDRTGLGAPLDITRNVTCLTPNDQAFLRAGSPNATASIFDLEQLTKFHIITEPLYSNFLSDGQVYTSFSNQSVRVTMRDGDTYFNDAKVLNMNVMTNNGLMHVLDRIMSPLDSENGTTSSSTSSRTSSATTTSGSSSSGTALVNPTATTSAATSSSSAAAGVVVGSARSSVLTFFEMVLGLIYFVV